MSVNDLLCDNLYYDALNHTACQVRDWQDTYSPALLIYVCLYKYGVSKVSMAF